MKLLKQTTVLLVTAMTFFALACSEEGDKIPIFQNNNGYTAPGGAEYDPFASMPGWTDPVLDPDDPNMIPELFDPIGDLGLVPQDQTVAETEYDQIVAFLKQITYGPLSLDSQTIEVLDGFYDVAYNATIAQPDRGIYGMMEGTAKILEYIINQDALDEDGTASSYADNLYVFMDDINDAGLDVKGDVYLLLFKALRFINTYGWLYGTSVETNMDSVRGFLADNTGQTVSGLLYTFQEGIGKLMLRAGGYGDAANDYIHFTDPLGWNPGSNNNIELGNAIEGIDLLLTAVNDIAANDADARDALYGILVEVGKLLNALDTSDATYSHYAVLKRLLYNIESYFTVGGTNYTGAYNDTMSATKPDSYSNAELRNGVKNIWPHLAKLFIRERSGLSTDPDYSIIYNPDATDTYGHNERSVVERLSIALNQLKNINLDYSQETNALEPSLELMGQYNALGELRSGGTAYKFPFLDHMMMTIAGGYYFGYLTRIVPGDNASGEPIANCPESGIGWGDAQSYQHGASTKGILTINDTMFALGSGSIHVTASMGASLLDTYLDSYILALNDRVNQGQHIWRSAASFTAGASTPSATLRFYEGYDFPALALLPPNCAGDVGIPTGGQRAIVPTSNTTTMSTPSSVSQNDFRTFFPKVDDGVGNLNTSAWIFSWIARACWDGAGPYYSTAIPTGVTITNPTNNGSNGSLPDWTGKASGDSYYVYFKPNGEVYAYVDKDLTPYLYYYPVTGNDVADSDSGANGQRENRFRDVVKSDYYVVQRGTPHGDQYVDLGTGWGLIQVGWENPLCYCTPPMNPEGQQDGAVDLGESKFHLAARTSVTARPFHVYEKVQEWTNTNVSVGDDPYQIIGNQSRECVSQEEAMYRNYQWLMLEKKFIFPIPMWLCQTFDVLGDDSTMDSAVYVVIEANGVVGASSPKKGGDNGQWNVRSGTEGLGTNRGIGGQTYPVGTGTDNSTSCNATTLTRTGAGWTANAYQNQYVQMGTPPNHRVFRITSNTATVLTFAGGNSGLTGVQPFRIGVTPYANNPDYGDSLRPGDARLIVFANYFNNPQANNGEVTPDVTWDLLGSGYIMPRVVGANIGPVARLGFVDQSAYVTSNFSTGGVPWTTRNKLLPIFVALAGVMRDGTRYYTPAGYTDPNYNYAGLANNSTAGHHKYPLMDLLEGVMIPLAAPNIRLWDDGGTTYGTRWVPRMNNESGGSFSFFARNGTGTYTSDNDFYPGTGTNAANNQDIPTFRTLTSFLADTQTSTYGDGLLSVLDNSNSRVVSKLLGLLQRTGDISSTSIYRDAEGGGLGILENMSKGLEQIVTGVQVDRGPVIIGSGTYSYSWLDTSRYNWMFTDVSAGGYDRRLGAIQPISVDLKVALDELIGDDTKGISQFVDDHATAGSWANYDIAFDALGELLGDGSNSIMGNATTDGTLIYVVNKLLTGIPTTSADRQALRHTLGVLMYRDTNGTAAGGWTTNTELRDLLRTHLPDILTGLDGHYTSLFLVLQALLDYDNTYGTDGEIDPEILDYLMDLLVPVDGAENIVDFLYRFMNRAPMYDPAYYTGGYLGRDTWKELADIFGDIADRIP